MLTWAIYVYNFWDSRYRKKKKEASDKDLCPTVGGSFCLNCFNCFNCFNCLHFLVACLLED